MYPSCNWAGWTSLGWGDRLRSIGAARNADGRLEAFGTAGDNTIWHNWQTWPGGDRAGWTVLGNVADRLTSIAAATNADGRLEAFGTAGDDSIWHNWQITPGGDWAGWTTLGWGDRLRSIAAATNADGRLEAFGTARGDSIWHNWQITPGGGWAGWGRWAGVTGCGQSPPPQTPTAAWKPSAPQAMTASGTTGRSHLAATGPGRRRWAGVTGCGQSPPPKRRRPPGSLRHRRR